MSFERIYSPAGYLLTFSTYGSRLHGRAAGSVDKTHNQYGSPFLEPDDLRLNIERKNMRQSPIILSSKERQIVLDAAFGVCIYKNWQLFAVHVRTEHVHLVIKCDCEPRKAAKTIKAWATKSIRDNFPNFNEKKIWTRSLSARYIWKSQNIAAAIDYVIKQQGEPMQMYYDSQYYQP